MGELDNTDSELDELTSDEEYVEKPAKGKSTAAKTKQHSDGYTISGVLKAPRAVNYACASIHSQILEEQIDLNPDYQRSVVWPDIKQIGLIDSIIRNYYVPPIIFVVHQESDGTETRTCVDGKQRLTSIRRFMDGEIYHRDIFTGKKYWYTEPPRSKSGQKRQGVQLSEAHRKQFDLKQITCMEYDGISGDEEREIFKRVQLGLALTASERLQAITGQAATITRKIVDEFLNTQLLTAGGKIEFDSTRGTDFRCTAQSIYNIVRYSTEPKNLGSITQLEKWLEDPDGLTPAVEKQAFGAYTVFSALANTPSLADTCLKKPNNKIPPVEFIAIVVLIAIWQEKASLEQLAQAISQLRLGIRKKHTDIRLNDRVGRDYITRIREINPTKLKGSGEAALTAAQKFMKKHKPSSSKATPLLSARREPTPPPATKKASESSTKKRKVRDESPETPLAVSAKKAAPASTTSTSTGRTTRNSLSSLAFSTSTGGTLPDVSSTSRTALNASTPPDPNLPPPPPTAPAQKPSGSAVPQPPASLSAPPADLRNPGVGTTVYSSIPTTVPAPPSSSLFSRVPPPPPPPSLAVRRDSIPLAVNTSGSLANNLMKHMSNDSQSYMSSTPSSIPSTAVSAGRAPPWMGAPAPMEDVKPTPNDLSRADKNYNEYYDRVRERDAEYERERGRGREYYDKRGRDHRGSRSRSYERDWDRGRDYRDHDLRRSGGYPSERRDWRR